MWLRSPDLYVCILSHMRSMFPPLYSNLGQLPGVEVLLSYGHSSCRTPSFPAIRFLYSPTEKRVQYLEVRGVGLGAGQLGDLGVQGRTRGLHPTSTVRSKIKMSKNTNCYQYYTGGRSLYATGAIRIRHSRARLQHTSLWINSEVL